MRFSTTLAITGLDWGHLKQSKGGIGNLVEMVGFGFEFWRYEEEEDDEKKKKSEERKMMERTRRVIIKVFGANSF